MSVTDDAISRVNYFNGQRLEASDFRAEQDYQIAVRRKLFASLYSVGIVTGLEVTVKPADAHRVIVAPGVALDFLGREIILVEATEVIAAGTATTNPAAIFGNYLVISYAEIRTQAVSDGCTTSGNCGGNLAWGGQTRIVAQPLLQFTDTFPTPTSGQIVLAQVALDSGCSVNSIVSGIRQYAVAAKPPTTRPISLEGEKDLDSQNPKALYFHIDGGLPDSVTLYLRADKLSSLYYTELGKHTHDNDVSSNNPSGVLNIPDHTHNFTEITTAQGTQDPTKPAAMIAWTQDDTTDIAIRMWGGGLEQRQENLTTLDTGSGPIVELQNLNAHTHTIDGKTDPAGAGTYNFPTLTVTVKPAGVADVDARATGDKSLTYFNSLVVKYDGQDITKAILVQLSGTDPGNWPSGTTLGDGTSTHPIVIRGDGTGGTGAIALDQLGLDFSPGQHSLQFSLASSDNGGKVQYNLYVE